VSTSLWDQLRRIRANVQGLQRSLLELKSSGTRFDEVLERETGLWAANQTQVQEGITSAQAVVAAGGAGADEIADEIDLLDNDWDRVKAYWTSLSTSPPDAAADREGRIAELDVLLAAMVRRLGFLTIPGRVAAYLRRQRIGGAFDFHAAFKDELPVEADRIDVLQYLRGSPEGVYGVVDVATGIIWATSPDPAKQRRTYIVTILIGLAGLLATIGACTLNLGGPFVAARRDELAIAYIGVAAGVLVHILIDLYKQSRSTDRTKNWSAVQDLVLWGHAHQTQIYITTFSVWAGLIALPFIFEKVEPFTAFIAGYSLDSFLDAALLRFSGSLEAGTATVKKQIEGA
jgi:hypothetical protein